MPLFNEAHDENSSRKHEPIDNYVFTLDDCFRRGIPVTSIEFNPPPVSCLEKQEIDYWRNLGDPDDEDKKILTAMKGKLKSIRRCLDSDAFLSVTDSAAGVLRLHNLTMMSLLSDPIFMDRRLGESPIIWEPRRTIVHLTRNHDIPWTRGFLTRCKNLGFTQLLLITGDPLKEVRLKPATADEAMAMDPDEALGYRLKNSIELLTFVNQREPGFYLGAGHNPFLKREVAEKHLARKAEAGIKFIITQPVSYYDECWRVMADFENFREATSIKTPVILGVFNYSVPCGVKGFREEVFAKRYRFWKRLFGFVPQGVREDYDRGLNGIEILARSINKLKRMGYHHFDVMNAEKSGSSVLINRLRLTHESDRISGSFDTVQ